MNVQATRQSALYRSRMLAAGAAAAPNATSEPFGSSMIRAWRNRGLRSAVLFGVAAFLVLEVLFVAWVHYCFEGRFYGPLLPSPVFGVPQSAASLGVQPVVHRDSTGWDGQFYYYQSNDLLARDDTIDHLDNPAYRYQRIGAPLLARAASTLLGYSLTPPFLYHLVQIAFTALGFGVLVYWLVQHQWSPWYAFAWLASGGVVTALYNGLPDAVGDAFFIFAFCALWYRRIGWYVLTASLLVLIREGYVVFPFIVFLATLFGRFNWLDVENYWKRLALAAIPGIVLVLWTGYLTLHFHGMPNLPERTPGGLVDWPFAGFARTIIDDWNHGDRTQIKLKIISVVTLAVVLVVLLRRLRCSLPLACTLPYVLLTTTLGTIVWWHYSGHMKANGTILIIGLFLLPIDQSVLLRFVLIANALFGLELHNQVKIRHAPLFSPCLASLDMTPNKDYRGPENPCFEDFRSEVAWVNPESTLGLSYHGAWYRWHREMREIRVAVTNRSTLPWLPAPAAGERSVNLGSIVFAADGVTRVAEYRTTLGGPLQPGESREITAAIPVPKPGRYVLQLSMIQEHVRWFYEAESEFGARYEITIE